MAEFVEVINQRNRMCKINECVNCELLFCMSLLIEQPEKAEKIIMEWAKEHPVITNADKFKEVFGTECAPEGCDIIHPQDCEGDCAICKDDNFWNKEYKEPKQAD